MSRKISLLITAFLMTFNFASANEGINSIAQSKEIAASVSSYVKELKAKRANQSVDEIMAEKYADIDGNMQVLLDNGAPIAKVEEMRMLAYDTIEQKFGGIDDASVLTSLEVAEIESTFTADNLMFIFTKENLGWYNRAASGSCYAGPFGASGCLVLTMMCTPFAVLGDVILLPATFFYSAVTGF